MRLKLVLLIIIISSLFFGINSWPILWLLSNLENESQIFFDDVVLSMHNANINSPYTLKTKDASISFLSSGKMGLELSPGNTGYIEIKDVESIDKAKGWTFASLLMVNKNNRAGLSNIFWAGSTEDINAPNFSLFFNSSESQLHFSTIYGAINTPYNSIKHEHFHIIVLQLDPDLQTMTFSLDGRDYILKNPNIIYKMSNLFYIGRGGVPEHSISGGIAEINIWNRPLSSQEFVLLYKYYQKLNDRIVSINTLIQKIIWILVGLCMFFLMTLILRDHGNTILLHLKRFYTGSREPLLELARELDVEVKEKTNFEIKQELLMKIKPYIEINTLNESQIDSMLVERLF
jgi:hypothetical protein